MTQDNDQPPPPRAQFGGPAQGDGEQQTKGSGHRGDLGDQSTDTSRLEREGHEFARTGESEGNRGEGVGEARTGSIDPELERGQRAASTGTTSGGDSWRPSADPAAGDMATGTDEEDETQQQGSRENP